MTRSNSLSASFRVFRFFFFFSRDDRRKINHFGGFGCHLGRAGGRGWVGGLPSQRTQGSQFEYSTLWSWAVTFRNTKKSPFLHPTAGPGTEIAQRVALRRLRELKLRRPRSSPNPPFFFFFFSVQFFIFTTSGLLMFRSTFAVVQLGVFGGSKIFLPPPNNLTNVRLIPAPAPVGPHLRALGSCPSSTSYPPLLDCLPV